MTRALVLTLLATALIAAPVHRKPTRSTKSAHLKTVNSRGGKRTGRAGGRRRSYVRAAPVPRYQTHPDPGRYTEIQKALADRGYYKGEVNGQWGEDSTDAMRRFQADQKLDGDGKLTALSLTGLGLGPRHDGSTASLVPLSAVDHSQYVEPTEGPVPTAEPNAPQEPQ